MASTCSGVMFVPWSVSLPVSGAKLLLVGALVERLDLAVHRLGMRGARGSVHVGLWARPRIEVPVLVGAANEHRRVPDLGLTHVGGDVADREADATIGAAVGLRA